MLISLIVKYFFHNKKRTYRAVAILAVGISLVLSTDMLLNGYISQVEEFSSIIDVDSREIEIIPKQSFVSGFSQNTLDNIRSIESQYSSISSYLEMYSTIARDSDDNSLEVTLTNISILKDMQWIQTDINETDVVLISQTTDLFEINDNILVNIRGETFEFNQSNEYISLDEITSELIIDFDNSLMTEDLSTLRNTIFLSVSSDNEYDSIINDLEQIDGIEVLTQNPANKFLKISGRQVTSILLLLQLGMSVLLILSISYVMLTLINESEDDIRILKMIGLEKWALFSIFMGQSILSALFASILALVISVMILYGILPFITLTGLPYGVVVINMGFFGITLIQSLIIGILAGLYPSYVGSK